MKKLLLIISFLLSAFSITYARGDGLSIRTIEEKFKSFEYLEVLSLSDKLLARRQELSEKELTQILEMRAISYYSLGETESSLNSFLEILKIKPEFELDPVKTSPKIISFYQEVRSSFLAEQEDSIRDRQALDSLRAVIQTDTYREFRGSMIRSIILPGWGHLHAGYSPKGWLLATISAVTLGAAIYFTVDMNSKENAYLNETDRALIESKYDQYNTAYKTRNILIATYSAAWLYSQIDLLYLSQKSKTVNITSVILPPVNLDSHPTLAIRLNVSL
jgi:tetratricopeptide (TPR) repeat protein